MIKKVTDYLKNHMVLTRSISFVLLFVLIWVLYDIFVPLSKMWVDDRQTIRTLMAIVPIICLGVGCYLKGNNRLSIETLALLIMLAGFSMRIGYAFYTGASTRQHDVEMYYNDLLLTYENGGQGHFAYTAYIFEHWALPNEIKWQFYHPPLWHALCALFMKVYSFFERENDLATLYNACMILSSYVACITLYACKKLIFEIIPNYKGRAISLLLISFHSQFFIMAGWMNNEQLALMFTILSIYFAIRYHKSNSWVNIVMCAISIGCGMMSKISAATIALPVGIIFIYDLVRNIKEKKTLSTLAQFGVFLLICAPLGLWFQVKNIVQFGIESIKIPAIDTNSSLSVINYSIWERFGLFNPLNFSEGIFCILRPNKNGYMDYNVWLYTLKCSVFGEYSYWGGAFFSVMLLIANFLLVILCTYSLFDVVIREWKTENRNLNILMVVIIIESLVAYIYFQITNPVTCTQDFRYMTFILIPAMYFIGKSISEIKGKTNFNIKNIIIYSVVILFVANSFLMFISVR